MNIITLPTLPAAVQAYRDLVAFQFGKKIPTEQCEEAAEKAFLIAAYLLQRPRDIAWKDISAAYDLFSGHADSWVISVDKFIDILVSKSRVSLTFHGPDPEGMKTGKIWRRWQALVAAGGDEDIRP